MFFVITSTILNVLIYIYVFDFEMKTIMELINYMISILFCDLLWLYVCIKMNKEPKEELF